MKAQTILDAILAMRDMDAITYTTEPAVWAKALTKLYDARYELEAELGAVGVEIEKPSEVQAWAVGGPTTKKML